VIANGATDYADPVCIRAVEILGGIAGTYLATRSVSTVANGGVYIVGGVALDAPFMHFVLERSAFLARFQDTGAMSALSHDIPIFRVTNPYPGLVGAAEIARHLR
jgi:glucokinase